MNIFQALQNDHETVKDLLEQLVSVSENDESTKVILDEIKDELIPHARAEEVVFYNSLRELDSAKDTISHAYREHMRVETLLHTLRGMEVVGIEWTVLAKKLRDEVHHHITEEEGVIFNMARPLLTPKESEELGNAFLAMKEEAGYESDFSNTVDLVANMMPKRFAESVRNWNHPG
jgi:hypothetical protein